MPLNKQLKWWQEMILYQVYPRSLRDTSGNGVGDLTGIREKVELFSQFLGVDALWLSPVHPSPQLDHGYDISDYTAIDPAMGTLDDFDALVTEARRSGMRIIMDGVFNHCSDRHPWFQSALHHPEAGTRDYFVWHTEDEPPNNWGSVMGGSAWSWSPTARAHYLHSFLPQQPDLNWHSPRLVEEVLQIMRFWLDRGIGGFRLDVFNCYAKDIHRRSNPSRSGVVAWLARRAWPYGGQEHIYDRDRPELADILGRMRELAESYDAVLLGETLDEQFRYDNAAQWVGPRGLHMAFHFGLLQCSWDARAMGRAIQAWSSDLGEDGWPTWVLSNHDFVRQATRWGGRHREARMRLAAMMLLSLRGSPCLYQGEEIGMVQGRIPRSKIQDPAGRKFWPFYRGRDGCRTPMQWDSSPHGGFSTAEPWLPVNPDWSSRNVDTQIQDGRSLIHLYRDLIALRKGHAALSRGTMQLVDPDHPHILSWRREHDDEHLLVALNLSARSQSLSVDPETVGEVLISTHEEPRDTHSPHILQPHEGRIIRLRAAHQS